MNNKVLSLLGLARRAGRLTCGFDSVCGSVRKHESRLLLISADISEGTLSKLKSEIGSAELVPLDCTMEQIDAAIGKPVRIISVNDDGFAQRIRQEIRTGNGEEFI